MDKPIAYNYVRAEERIAELTEKVSELEGILIHVNLDKEHAAKTAYAKGYADGYEDRADAHCEKCEYQLTDEEEMPCRECMFAYTSEYTPKEEKGITCFDCRFAEKVVYCRKLETFKMMRFDEKCPWHEEEE